MTAVVEGEVSLAVKAKDRLQALQIVLPEKVSHNGQKRKVIVVGRFAGFPIVIFNKIKEWCH